MFLGSRRFRHTVFSLAAFTAVMSTPGFDAEATVVQANSQRTVTAFVDVSVIPMDQEQVLPGQTVLVQGDRITALGPNRRVPVPAGAIRIDGRGKFLMPGLADMHAHLSASTTVANAERMLFLFAANGVTTIRNMDRGSGSCFLCIDEKNLLQLRARVAAGELWSPRIYTSGSWRGSIASPDSSIEDYLRAYQAAGYDFIKPYWEDRTTLDSLAVIGCRLGLTLQGHAYPNADTKSREAALEGLAHALTTHKSIEHLMGYPGLLYVGGFGQRLPGLPNDSTELQQLAVATRRAGVWNCPTLVTTSWGTTLRPRTPLEARYASAERRRLGDTSSGVLSPSAEQLVLLDHARRAVRELHRVGAGLLLGTDAISYMGPSAGYGVHHELAALVQAGLTPYEALATGTRNVAVFWGTLDSTGTVAPSKRADLLLLSANPLVDIQNSGQIAGVMVAGRWLPVATIEQRLAAYYPDSVFPARLSPATASPKVKGPE